MVQVLILVLMEDTLRVDILQEDVVSGRLNPCFNGRYSQSFLVVLNSTFFKSLNPCFNGRYSQRVLHFKLGDDTTVLILVLMEDTLRVIESLIKAGAKSS